VQEQRSNAGQDKVPAQAPAIDVFSMQAAARPDKLALICGERSLTYAALNARANRVANVLRKLGANAGDRIAVMVYNSLEGIEIGAAASKISAILVPVNYRLREREVTYVLNDSEAKVVFVAPELVDVVDRARAEMPGSPTFVAIGGEAPAGWLRYEEVVRDAGEEMPLGKGSLGSTMSYTSGTTGNPKGAYRPKGISLANILAIVQAYELAESPAPVAQLRQARRFACSTKQANWFPMACRERSGCAMKRWPSILRSPKPRLEACGTGFFRLAISPIAIPKATTLSVTAR